jgi:transaldolase
LAYQAWQQSFAGPRWERLRTAGARVQRPLWASTSTKDPAYPDVRYVEPLIGPQTISTMPEETMNAFRDHGRVALSLVQDLDEAQEVIGRLAKIGINMSEVGTRLVDEGISKFNQPFEELLRAIEAQRQDHRGR